MAVSECVSNDDTLQGLSGLRGEKLLLGLIELALEGCQLLVELALDNLRVDALLGDDRLCTLDVMSTF